MARGRLPGLRDSEEQGGSLEGEEGSMCVRGEPVGGVGAELSASPPVPSRPFVQEASSVDVH